MKSRKVGNRCPPLPSPPCNPSNPPCSPYHPVLEQRKRRTQPHLLTAPPTFRAPHTGSSQDHETAEKAPLAFLRQLSDELQLPGSPKADKLRSVAALGCASAAHSPRKASAASAVAAGASFAARPLFPRTGSLFSVPRHEEQGTALSQQGGGGGEGAASSMEGAQERVWAAGQVLHSLRSELLEAAAERERAEGRLRAAEVAAESRSAEAGAELERAVGRAEAAARDLVELREASWLAREEASRLRDRLGAAEAEAGHLSGELAEACGARDRAAGLLGALRAEVEAERKAKEDAEAQIEDAAAEAAAEREELRGHSEGLQRLLRGLEGKEEELGSARAEVEAKAQENSELLAQVMMPSALPLLENLAL